EALASLPFESTGSATVDHHRGLRQHLPEVILCQGKTVAECIEIARAIVAKSGRCLATRASEGQAEALLAEFDGRATWNERARAVVIAARAVRGRRAAGAGRRGDAFVLVVSAGTSDLPVAEEAAVTLEFMGLPVRRVYDAGVAGI